MNPGDLFAPLPASAGEAWERLERFATAWWRALGPKDRVSPAVLNAAEKRLGVRLPREVRAAHERFGRYSEIFDAWAPWVPVEKLVFLDDVLVIRIDDGDMAFLWGIRRGDLGQDDPPVVIKHLDSGGAWVDLSPRFSEYVVLAALVNAIDSSPYRNRAENGGRFEAPAELRSLVVTKIDACRSETVLHMGEDLLVVRYVETGDLGIGGRTLEACERAMGFFPEATWEYGDEEMRCEDYRGEMANVRWLTGVLREAAQNLPADVWEEMKKMGK
jgi:hypothetical protein